MVVSYAPFELEDSTSLFMKGVCKGQRKCGKCAEKFMGIGSSKSKSRAEMNNEQRTYQENVDKKLKEEFINNMTSVVQKNATNIANQNQQQMMVELKATNVIKLSDVKVTGGDVNIGNLNQANEIDSKATMEGKSSVTVTINKETSTTTNNQISKHLADKKTLDKTLPGLLNKAVAAVPPPAKTGDALVGSTSASSEAITNIKRDDTVINKAIEKSKTDINVEEAIESAMEETIKSDNLQQCGANIQANNSMVFENIDAKEGIKLNNNEQKNVIDSVVDCQFSNEVINNIVTKMITNIEKQMEESSLTEEEQEGYGQAFAASVAAQTEVAKAEEETARVEAAQEGETNRTQAEESGETDREKAKQDGYYWLYFFICCCCCVVVIGAVAAFGMKTAGNKMGPGGMLSGMGRRR